MGSGGRGTRSVGLEQVSSSCSFGVLLPLMGGEYRSRVLSFKKVDQVVTFGESFNTVFSLFCPEHWVR